MVEPTKNVIQPFKIKANLFQIPPTSNQTFENRRKINVFQINKN